MPNSQTPAHWSKDFVEHLRTVHFALITISAGLILLVCSSKEYNSVRALVQIEEILDLKKNWSVDWIREHADPLPDYKNSEAEVESWLPTKKYTAFTIRGNTTSVANETFTGWYFEPRKAVKFVLHIPKVNWFHPNATLSDWSERKFPGSLGEFEKWWEGLNRSRNLYVPVVVYSTYPVTDTNPDLGAEIKPAPDVPREGNIPLIDVQLDLLVQASLQDNRVHVAGFYSGTFDFEKRPRVVTVYITRYYQYALTQSAIQSAFHDLQPGLFAQSFRDLSIAAHDEADLPLETIKDFLHDEAAKGPEVFEAFGMKFPAGQITFWGAILLLSVQLYFLVYLRQLFGKLKPEDPGWDVPWIGMDSSALSKMILYISLAVLPVIASILLGWQATIRLSSGYWERAEHWYHPVHFLAGPWHWHYTVLLKIFLLIFAALASGYLGLLSWKYRPQIVPEPELPEYPEGLSKKWMR
jgi:hypothetical protein